jgi:glycosyltransferase involved in cell wall biosynthesis
MLASALVEHSDVELVHVITGAAVKQTIVENTFSEISNLIISAPNISYRNDGFVWKLFNFSRYFLSILGTYKNNQYDVIFASSSRLGTALVGAILSKILKVPYYLDLRDNIAETIYDFLPQRYLFPLRWAVKRLHELSIKQASSINTLSSKHIPCISKINKDIEIYELYHGVDKIFMVKKQSEPIKLNEKFQNLDERILVYAGNLGFAQGLDLLLPRLSELLPNNWVIHVYGKGNYEKQIRRSVSQLDNVIIKPPVDRSELPRIYGNAAALLLPLRDTPAFKNSLPSKFFELVGSGRPMMVCASGYVVSLISEYSLDGVFVFSDENLVEINQTLAQLDDCGFNREQFVEAWNRERLIDAHVESILSLVRA